MAENTIKQTIKTNWKY